MLPWRPCQRSCVSPEHIDRHQERRWLTLLTVWFDVYRYRGNVNVDSSRAAALVVEEPEAAEHYHYDEDDPGNDANAAAAAGFDDCLTICHVESPPVSQRLTAPFLYGSGVGPWSLLHRCQSNWLDFSRHQPSSRSVVFQAAS